MITLTPAGGSAIALPEDLEWPDEFEWAPLVTSEQRSLSGALIVHHSTAQSGRPITLASNGASWYPRAQVLALQALLDDAAAAVAAGNTPAPLALAYHGRTFAVAWRLAGTQPLEAVPVYRLADPDGTHPYLITLRLMEI
ncbi:hypothetical protein SAMN04487957_10594 [Halomonas shengliensis]|uniref:Uncharacterized protein n=1 Tax=Halomonas shengliensis TaxID=419597 RepID=A0A1H0IEP7_9GAMM|nr:hypothetical protein [Halomonas shengliensis]SDO29927.1 hypothetical protein SAMN04487957_10594 [Halomonas shengliensis]